MYRTGSRSAGGGYQQFQPIVSAVLLSMLHCPQLGVLLLLAHYLANFTVGILLRFTAPRGIHQIVPSGLLRIAVGQMLQYQAQHKQSIGAMLGQAVQKGIRSIVNIGGFVLMFSVLLQLLQASQLLQLLQQSFACLLRILQLDTQLAAALSAGLFEMTLGAQTAAESRAPLLQQLMIISFILGWSGLSIQAQVSSILSGQKISSRLYCLCRPLQGLLAAAYIPLLTVLFPQILSADVFWSTEPMPAAMPYLSLYLCPLAALLLLLLLAAISRLYDIYRARTHLS